MILDLWKEILCIVSKHSYGNLWSSKQWWGTTVQSCKILNNTLFGMDTEKSHLLTIKSLNKYWLKNLASGIKGTNKLIKLFTKHFLLWISHNGNLSFDHQVWSVFSIWYQQCLYYQLVISQWITSSSSWYKWE